MMTHDLSLLCVDGYIAIALPGNERPGRPVLICDNARQGDFVGHHA